MTTETTTAANRYLALYTGPNGPVSHEFECESLEVACDIVREFGRVWYDHADDALGLPSEASDSEVVAAVARGGWRHLEVTDQWDIYGQV